MFTENLDDFLDVTDGHALDATYDGATPVKVIFDNEYLELDAIAGRQPVALGRGDVFPEAAVDKTLVILGVTYTIKNREPVDDGAFVRLRLRRD